MVTYNIINEVQIDNEFGRKVMKTTSTLKGLFVFASLFVSISIIAQTKVFLQEDFSGNKKKDFSADGWVLDNGSIDVSGDALIIKKEGFFCAPVISPVDVTSFDQFVVSFKYKNPKPQYNNADKLEVYIAEGYKNYGNIGKSQLILTSESADNFKYFSFAVSNWTLKTIQLVFRCYERGGNDIYIDDVQIKGVKSQNSPVATIGTSNLQVFNNGQVQLFDLSSEAPNKWSWEIIPGKIGTDFQYVSSTTSASQNPIVQFNTSGVYSLKLSATNSFGTSSKMESSYITVGCIVKSNNINSGYINSVQLNNSKSWESSSNSGYSLNIDNPQGANIGDNLKLQVTCSNVDDEWAWSSTANKSSRNLAVWIDWDRNGLFDEASYSITLAKKGKDSTGSKDSKKDESKDKSQNSDYSGEVTITPPDYLAPGSTRIRVKFANKTSDVANACSDVTTGEIEDYVINFSSASISDLLGNAYNFNGGYAESSKAIFGNTTQNFTISGWFKADASTLKRGFIGQSTDFKLGIDNGNLVFWSENGGSISIPWKYTNQWVNIAVTGSESALTMYVNGTEVGSSSKTVSVYWANPIGKFRFANGIFSDDFSTDPPFIGSMDEVSLWNIALDQATIQANMYSTLSSKTNGLVSYYQFNDVVIENSLKDWKGNKHADLYNSTLDSYCNSSVPFIWTGKAGDNSFTTAENWSWGANEMPRVGNKVIVYPSQSPLVVASGTVLNFGTLDLQPGSKFTVNGTLNLTDSLIIRNTAETPSSIIVNGTLNVAEGKTSVVMSYPTLRYWYAAPPVQGSSSASFNASNTSDVLLYWYNNPSYVRITDNVTNLSEPMRGYAIQFKTPAIVSSAGTIASGDQSINLAKAGWQLVANPYASYVDLNQYASQWDFSKVSKSIWIYTTYNENRVFGIYNLATGIGTNGVTRYLSPGQAFWVRSNTPGVFAVSAGARTHGEGGSLKSASSDPSDVLRVSLTNSYLTEDAVLVFRDIGSLNYNDAIDSEKRVETYAKVPYFYSMKDNRKVAINVLPADPSATTIPLAFQVGKDGAGELTLKAENIATFMTGFDVILEDTKTGDKTNLREVPEYKFKTDAVTNQPRFTVSFVKRAVVEKVNTETPSNVSTGVGDAPTIDANDNIKMMVFSIGKKAIVKVIDPQFGGDVLIEAYDQSGQKQHQSISYSNRTEVLLPDGGDFYIVRVVYKGIEKSFKIMIWKAK